MSLDLLRNKKVAVLGLSVEGLSTARFLKSRNIAFTILEKKGLWELSGEAQEFIKINSINYFSGENHLERIGDYDVIFRSPGIPLWLPQLREAQTRGATVTSHTKLFFDLCPASIIGVTGTKGKGTTATLIYEMIKASGKEVFLGGNIGEPPLNFLDRLQVDSWAVLELSSFQLEDLEKSPHLAVLLMVTQEHLNSQAPESPNYHISICDYLEAKKNITRFQKEGDFAVVNADFPNSMGLIAGVKSKVIYFSTKRELPEGAYLKDDKLLICLNKNCHLISGVEEVFLRGRHNLQNILAAAAAAFLAGADASVISAVAKTFRGLEHRLEFVREVDGVKFYNDSFATTPETAIAAIQAFTEPEIIILGGSEKGSDYTRLGQIISGAKNVKALILIGVTVPKIKEAIRFGLIGLDPQRGSNPLGNLSFGMTGEASSMKKVVTNGKGVTPKIGVTPILVEDLNSMVEIVGRAKEIASSGDVVLLSPACASFDMFKNYKDRGRQFKDEVKKLEIKPSPSLVS